MRELGLLIVGDFALATGRDGHLPYVVRTLAEATAAGRVVWTSLLPAEPVAIAAGLLDAWSRPVAVACFGGLGDGSDDFVRACVLAQQSGRREVGLSPRPQHTADGVLTVGNITCFPGRPERAHPAFLRWWLQSARALSVATEAVESIRWQLPEPDAARAARSLLARTHPQVEQRLSTGADGAPRLIFTAASRGKAQAARKALQRLLTAGA